MKLRNLSPFAWVVASTLAAPVVAFAAPHEHPSLEGDALAAGRASASVEQRGAILGADPLQSPAPSPAKPNPNPAPIKPLPTPAKPNPNPAPAPDYPAPVSPPRDAGAPPPVDGGVPPADAPKAPPDAPKAPTRPRS